MNIFKKLFGIKDDETEGSIVQSTVPDLTPCKNKQELMERYGAIGFEKQLNIAEVIGNKSWNADLEKGEVSFGSKLVFPLQALGSFSYSSQTWLWAWANEESDLSENILQQANQLRKYGEDNNIDLLTNPHFEATDDDLNTIGIIASGIFNTSGYYLGNYGEGGLLMTIKGDKIDKISNNKDYRIFTVFSEFILEADVDHKPAFINYLSIKGFDISDNGSEVAASKNGNTVTAEFDEELRLKSLNGTIE